MLIEFLCSEYSILYTVCDYQSPFDLPYFCDEYNGGLINTVFLEPLKNSTWPAHTNLFKT